MGVNLDREESNVSYYDDEYYDDEYYNSDEWYEANSETSHHSYLYKAQNGHLVLTEGWLTRYPGEDWGEASGWSEYTFRLNELNPEAKKRCIELGRNLKPGTSTDFYWGYDDDDSTEQTDDLPF